MYGVVARITFISCLAAALVITAVSVVVLWQSDVRSASVTPAAGASQCIGPARTSDFFVALPNTPLSAITTDSLVSAFNATSVLPPSADVEAIMRTVSAVIACQNEGDFGRLSALFTDAYWLIEVGGRSISAKDFAQQAKASPTAPSEQMELRASFGDARLLEDGRIAGFLRWDQRQADDVQLVAFLQVDGVWRIDQVVFTDELQVRGTPSA